jgi:hypothetical protein
MRIHVFCKVIASDTAAVAHCQGPWPSFHALRLLVKLGVKILANHDVARDALSEIGASEQDDIASFERVSVWKVTL